MKLLRRFGGATLRDSLPSQEEFEKTLQENEELLTKLNARVTMLDTEIEVLAGRQLFEDKDNLGDENDQLV